MNLKNIYIENDLMLSSMLKDINVVLSENSIKDLSIINSHKYLINVFVNSKTEEIIGVAVAEKRFPVNLSKFAINKKHQKNGLGSKVFSLWLDDLNNKMKKNGAENYTIHIECDNETKGFYQRQGFVEYGGYKLKKANNYLLERFFMCKNVFL